MNSLIALINTMGMGLILLGMPFFFAGTLGLLRFPDVYTRTHALTKADNLGLGFVSMGLALQAESVFVALKILLVWLLVLLTSAAGAQLIARTAHGLGIRPWRR
jgi:multicomponent Na+:H+ antiporter subunit G